ncbi:MAG: DUF488 family protein [Gammaproteobacteria bacterium]
MDDNTQLKIFTIGYKHKTINPDINAFIYSLEFYGITSLIDIRPDPMPTDFPEFDRGHLHQSCEDKDIVYHWAGLQLGNSVNSLEVSKHDALQDINLRAYADYMGTRNFQIAAAQVINMARLGTVALFSELIEPEKNFRVLLSDYLLLQGMQVNHIISVDDLREHLLHKCARRESVELIYDKLD